VSTRLARTQLEGQLHAKFFGVAITPDTKDWTWVLERPCGECNFNADNYPRESISGAVRDTAHQWPALLRESRAKSRTREDRWSVLEYACHVRDVYRVFDDRLTLMIANEDPEFENWDQDETATRERYDLQDPLVVAEELLDAGTTYARRLDTLRDEQWARSGTRSNGSHFTVATLALYGLHDPFHHLWDVTNSTS
jgi:hypothetical protein